MYYNPNDPWTSWGEHASGLLVSSDGDVVHPHTASVLGFMAGGGAKGKGLTVRRPHRYRAVSLWRDGRSATIRVHVLVLETFVGPRPSPDFDADHIDTDKLNNRVDNLRWIPAVENRGRWAA